MAQATLNSAIPTLDTTSLLYDLYTRLYDGMTQANQVDTPDYIANPIYEQENGADKLDADGAKIVDVVAMEAAAAAYTEIQMKNSAYMLANAIITSVSGGTGGGGGTGMGFVSRSGDTMQGSLGALYGFEAGHSNTKIFETIINASNESWAIVTGNLQVTNKAKFDGEVHVADTGIYFGGNQSIYLDQGKLCISSQDINLIGAVEVDGSIKIGNVLINTNGVFNGTDEYYNSGNSNKSDVDWTMKDANVHGNLHVYGTTQLDDKLTASGGFKMSMFGQDLLYTENDVQLDPNDNSVINNPYLTMAVDLSIVNGHGIKFDGNYIIFVKSGTDNVVSFSAPGKVLNLGDKGVDSDGNDLPTNHIALQTAIKNYNGAYTIVSQNGDGNFPNSFSAGVANGIGTPTMRTFYSDANNYGVMFKNQVRFGSEHGPYLYGQGDTLIGALPYVHIEDGTQVTDDLQLSLYYAQTTSLFHDPVAYPWSATLHIGTDAEFFEFDKPVEATFFSIKSSTYKTRLQENALFFGDNKFIEGITDGIRYSQNSYFDGSLSSQQFSSGFAGSGWAVLEDQTAGGIHATFDSLTIRKKMRVYELEVQKISVTNGSLWVSDSCSGDEVMEL